MDRKLKELIQSWLVKKEYRCFKLDGLKVICQKCSTSIKIKDRRGSSRLKEHIKTPRHQRAVKSTSSQSGIATSLEKAESVNVFNYELFLIFVSENIPLFHLRSDRFRQFFLKYANQHVECAQSPEKYISFGYRIICDKIEQRFGSVPYAIYIDETQDVKRRKIVNTIVVPLTGEPEKPVLVDTDFVSSANKVTLSGIINRVAMSISKDASLFKLLVTDQCRTNIAVGRDLRLFYPNFMHVTCLAHAVHLLCESIREKFDKVNSFVANMKSAIQNSKARVDLYRELTGNAPLPPKPVTTRWGTFLKAAFHHHKHFEGVRSFVMRLEGTAMDVNVLKKLVDDPELETQFGELTMFSELPDFIEQLESRDITLNRQISILDSITSKLDGDLLARFQEVLGRNPDLEQLRNHSNDESGTFVNAVLCNAEVERSFSLLKNIITDRRHNLSESNVKRYLSIQFNAYLLHEEE